MQKGGEIMGKFKSTTKDNRGIFKQALGIPSYKTKISGGGRSATGYGYNSKQSQKSASKKWKW